MPLNASGPISLGGSTTGESIALELGQSATSQISLNDANVRALAQVPSGAITMPSNFWGKGSGGSSWISIQPVSSSIYVGSGWSVGSPIILNNKSLYYLTSGFYDSNDNEVQSTVSLLDENGDFVWRRNPYLSGVPANFRYASYNSAGNEVVLSTNQFNSDTYAYFVKFQNPQSLNPLWVWGHRFNIPCLFRIHTKTIHDNQGNFYTPYMRYALYTIYCGCCSYQIKLYSLGVAKFDTDGANQWAIASPIYGGNNNNIISSPSGLSVNSNGTYVYVSGAIGGTTGLNTTFNNGFNLGKLNSGGVGQWLYSYINNPGPNFTNSGQAGNCVDQNDNIYVVTSGQYFTPNLTISKIDQDGEWQWSRTITETNITNIPNVTAFQAWTSAQIILGKDGFLYVVANVPLITNTGFSGGAYLVKMSTAGALQWARLLTIVYSNNQSYLSSPVQGYNPLPVPPNPVTDDDNFLYLTPFAFIEQTGFLTSFSAGTYVLKLKKDGSGTTNDSNWFIGGQGYLWSVKYLAMSPTVSVSFFTKSQNVGFGFPYPPDILNQTADYSPVWNYGNYPSAAYSTTF